MTEIVARRVSASPNARRIAKEANLDIQTVIGTGPNGMVTQADVQAAIAAALAPKVEETAVETAPTEKKKRGRKAKVLTNEFYLNVFSNIKAGKQTPEDMGENGRYVWKMFVEGLLERVKGEKKKEGRGRKPLIYVLSEKGEALYAELTGGEIPPVAVDALPETAVEDTSDPTLPMGENGNVLVDA